MSVNPKSLNIYDNDIPSDIKWGNSIAIDTETLGLVPHRDRLCTIQIADEEKNVHIVKFSDVDACLHAKNLQHLLGRNDITKIFHYARFDIKIIALYLHIWIKQPFYCTKIASKIARTYSSNHGLKDLVNECLGITLDKEKRSSYWGADNLTKDQLEYAARDVIFLHDIKEKLDHILHKEDRYELADNCFLFLPTRIKLDMHGWHTDIFEH